MENETIYRGITGILFVIILVTRKLYEKQAGEVENHDDQRLIGLQSLLLTISLIYYTFESARGKRPTLFLPDE